MDVQLYYQTHAKCLKKTEIILYGELVTKGFTELKRQKEADSSAKTAKTQGEDVPKTQNPRPCSETSEPICGNWDHEGNIATVKRRPEAEIIKRHMLASLFSHLPIFHQCFPLTKTNQKTKCKEAKKYV